MDKKENMDKKEYSEYFGESLGEELRMHFLDKLGGLTGKVEKATITVPVSPNAASFTRYVVPGLGEYDTVDEAVRAIKEKRSVSLGEYAVYKMTGSVRKVL